MNAGRNKHSHPRAVGGGRSPRYEARRHARGGVRRYAPEWSDAAAAALLSHLEAESQGKVAAYVGNWLTRPDWQEKAVKVLKLSPADRDLTTKILAFYRARVRTEEGRLHSIAKVFLKPLRERKAYRGSLRQLVVEPAGDGPPSFHAWLSQDPTSERPGCAINYQNVRGLFIHMKWNYHPSPRGPCTPHKSIRSGWYISKHLGRSGISSS